MEFNHSCPFAATVYGIYQSWSIPKLFRYADGGKWDLIPDRARKCPKEATFVHKYAPCDTALHRVLRPLHVVQSTAMTKPSKSMAPTPMIQASSCTTTPSDSSQHEDLDHKHRFSTDVLMPREVKRAKEKEERLLDEIEDPTGIANILLRAVEAILDANPDAACRVNLFGRTPLHLACMELNNSTTAPARAQAAMLLLQHSAARTAVRLEDHHGCTALHYLLTNSSNSIPRELMQTILDLDACALERKNNHGQSPLDVFAAFQQDDTVTRVRADDQKLDVCQVLQIVSTTSTSVDVVVGH